MIFILSAEKLHFVCYLSFGLLSLSLLTECDKIRLVGPSRCAGRVEVYHGDSWGTVCDDLWNLVSADVVCRELNCGTVLEAKRGAFFGEGKDQIWLDDVQCTGQESSILQCPHRPFGENNCGHGEDAGVICSESVKVVNGSNRCNGRVEIMHEGHWKRICSNDWNRAAAEVVCREINCGLPTSQTEEIHVEETRDLVAVKPNCIGNETSISHCRLQEYKENCVDATILCTHSKPIRLKNGTHRCSGRVEVFHDGQWGTVCDDRWGMPEAIVACREMNCGNPLAVKYRAFFGRGEDQVWLDDVECTGHERSLADCPHRGFGEHDCSHSEDAGIVCSDSLRVYNGTNRCAGRVEVFQDGRWVKICNNNWGQEQAAVVCQELHCGIPKTGQQPDYGESRLRGYTATCTGNVSSITQCKFQENTGSCEGVSVTCSDVPQLRIVNGTDRCTGRVEIQHDGQWGTICDDDWDIKDAQVVCRLMDCGTAKTAKSGAFFGQGEGPIWLDDVGCAGNETSILHCRHPSLGENNCGHGEDAGVVCSATIRLINGTDECSGRVEFYHENRWSAAFNSNWRMTEAAVVCREMNCGDAVKSSGSFGQSGAQRGYKVNCNGGENSLARCGLRAYTRTARDGIEEAAVVCSGNVRLSGGRTHCDGRVEYFDNGQWGNVCGEAWDTNDATVVCKQLGCGRVHTITTTAEYGQGTGQTWIDQILCNGMESTLAQCTQRKFTDRTCNTTSVAGVVCSGSLEVRLISNNNDECSGRVEVRHGEEWHTVCDTDWTQSKASVVCQKLECGQALTAPGGANFGQGTGSVVGASNSCFDNVTSLEKCSLTGFQSSSCGHDHDAGVHCAAQLRLIGGTSQCSGRVELLYKGQWGTVCDDEWELVNADVVCRQLGCGHAVSAPPSAHFGRGTGPIWLDNVVCTGQESSLTHCGHAGYGENNCGHSEDAGVICLGALGKPQIVLSPGPEVNWGDKVEITCSIVTEQLGGTFVLKMSQGSFKMEKYSQQEAATFVFPTVSFNQTGSYFCEYQKKLPNQVINYPQGNAADLTVKVKLEKPSISLTSPYAMVVYSPDKISVNQGSSFSVTCSTHSKYPGGFFYLTRSDTNTSEAKEAFSHTIFYLATFEFPEIEYKHQGEYKCVFAVNITSLTFRSTPSKPLQISVVSSSSSVASGVVIGLVLLLLVVVIGYVYWKKRWQGVGTLVQFSNRFGGTIKPDFEDRSNKLFEGRDGNTQMNEHGSHSRRVEDKKPDVDADNSVERVPEDLAGRVCYEFEPLVVP